MAKGKPSAVSAKSPQAPNWPRRLYALAGVGVAGLLVAVIAIDPGSVASGPPSGVQVVTVGDPIHVEGPIAYDAVVPAGGQHNPVPLTCGFYDTQVPTENVVHSLEHGAVWITYQPGTDDDTLSALRGVARDRRKAIVSEVEGQDSPLMATAWGFQLELDSVEDSRLLQFLNEYESAATAPEPGAACSGTGTPVG